MRLSLEAKKEKVYKMRWGGDVSSRQTRTPAPQFQLLSFFFLFFVKALSFSTSALLLINSSCRYCSSLTVLYGRRHIFNTDFLFSYVMLYSVLKGQKREVFGLYLCSWIDSIWTPDSYPDFFKFGFIFAEIIELECCCPGCDTPRNRKIVCARALSKHGSCGPSIV